MASSIFLSRRMKYILLTVFVLVTISARASASIIHLKEEYAAASNAVWDGFDEFNFPYNPARALNIRKEWRIVQAFAARYLNKHSHATAEQLSDNIKLFGSRTSSADRLNVQVVLLANELYLVSVRQFSLGHIFILTKKSGHYQSVWDITKIIDQPLNSETIKSLENWMPESIYPLAGSIKKLPSDQRGNQRFYIDAGMGGPYEGNTGGFQLSIWEWHNGRAWPLIVRDYSHYIDSGGVEYHNGQIRFGEEKHYQMFYTTIPDGNRSVTRVIRITPQGLLESETADEPRLDFIDMLFYRLSIGQAVDDIASESIADQIRQKIEKLIIERLYLLITEAFTDGDEYYVSSFSRLLSTKEEDLTSDLLGELGRHYELKGNRYRFESDVFPYSDFIFETRNGKPYLVNILPVKCSTDSSQTYSCEGEE